MPLPAKDQLANRLRALLGEERGYAITRRKNILQQQALWRFCQKYPKAARRLIRKLNVKMLPEGYPVDEHFNPPYNPWDQRLCFVPNGDLFNAIRAGRASVVTDRIATFTENGVLLESGRELEADIIVTATGLNVQAMGGMSLTVDGAAGPPARHDRLQGHDAVRRAELRLRDRLHQLLLDAEGRAAVRALLPAAHAHGRPRLRHRATRTRRPGDADAAVPELRRRLHPARDRPTAAPG